MTQPALLLDENIPYGLQRALRQRGWDTVHVKDIGMRSASDPEVLEAGILSNRIILTYNIGDFSRLDDLLRKSNRKHPGILVSVERPIGELLDRLERFDFSQIDSTFRHL
jgi:uncharacterized protein with PIN domain